MSNDSFGNDLLKGVRGTPDNLRSFAIYSELSRPEELRKRAEQTRKENEAAIAAAATRKAARAVKAKQGDTSWFSSAPSKTNAARTTASSPTVSPGKSAPAPQHEIQRPGIVRGDRRQGTTDGVAIVLLVLMVLAGWLLFA